MLQQAGVPLAGGASVGMVHISVLCHEQTNPWAMFAFFPGRRTCLSPEWSLRISWFGNETKSGCRTWGRDIIILGGMKLMGRPLARIKLIML